LLAGLSQSRRTHGLPLLSRIGGGSSGPAVATRNRTDGWRLRQLGMPRGSPTPPGTTPASPTAATTGPRPSATATPSCPHGPERREAWRRGPRCTDNGAQRRTCLLAWLDAWDEQLVGR